MSGAAARGAAGWLYTTNRISRERRDDQEGHQSPAEEVHFASVERPQPRTITVTYRKRKVLEHA